MQGGLRSCAYFFGLIAAAIWSIAPAIAQQANPTDAAESTAEATTEKKTPSEVCKPDESGGALIDRVHSGLFKLTCSSVSWFDGLFGDRRYDQEYRGTNGSLTVGSLWSQRNNFDRVLRFRAHVYLPQLSEKFHAFVGRSNREDLVTESQSELYSLPNQFNRGTDDDVFLGVGYAEPMRKHGSFSADTGVGLQFPLDPYVRGSYRYSRPVGDSNIMRLRESIFWENVEGFGTTGVIDWDHSVNAQSLLRWTNSGTYSENSHGLRWFSVLTLFYSMNYDRAFAYEVAANGRTDLPVPLEDYGAAVIFRQRVWRDYLILELRTGVDWPRQFLEETRRANLNAALAFELRYGRR